MPISLWTKFAAIALLAGSAVAWSPAPSAAQVFPSRAAVIDSQTQQVVQVGHHRRHAREHRRWDRHHRRHSHRYRHRDHFVRFGVAVPYVAAPVYAAPAYAAPVVAPTPCGSAVSVMPGDTMARIAARCGTTIGALLSANPHIINPHVIYAGQVIRMPWG